jgi:hypothetical protein
MRLAHAGVLIGTAAAALDDQKHGCVDAHMKTDLAPHVCIIPLQPRAVASCYSSCMQVASRMQASSLGTLPFPVSHMYSLRSTNNLLLQQCTRCAPCISLNPV